MRAAIYARVSLEDQNCEMQLRELREYCKGRGWTISGEYVDTGWSGSKASRPELDRVMRDAAQHRFDVITVWKLDRFGRSVLHLSQQLQNLESAGIRFIASTQGVDTDRANPTSRLLLHILAAVAEFEREIIRERAYAGLKRYREDFERGLVGEVVHSKSGRDLAHGRPRCVFDRQRVIEWRQKGLSIRAIAAKLRVSVGTIHNVISEWSPRTPKIPPKKAFKKLVPSRKVRR